MAETLKNVPAVHVLTVDLKALKEVAAAVPNGPKRHSR